ncbi:MAG: type II toxin-antitoxin system HicA family toxin [Candidatus Acidiferrales bacterium]
MAKLPRDVSGDHAVRAFKRVGYVLDHVAGSHAILMHPKDPRKRLVVPLHPVVKAGTLSRILKDAELTVDEFIELL